MSYGFGWILMWFTGLVVLAIIGLVIFLIVRAAGDAGKTGTGSRQSAPAVKSGRAMEILSERYARGEISDEEYRKIKDEIRKD